LARGVLLASEPAPGVPVVHSIFINEPPARGAGIPGEILEPLSDVPIATPPAVARQRGRKNHRSGRGYIKRHREKRRLHLARVIEAARRELKRLGEPRD
jgi:hypothetical protein